MRVSYQWLSELVDLPAEVTPKEVADRLTLAGLEVDAIEDMGAGLDGVIVARITAVEQHPDADKLSLVTVDPGGDQEKIVCGAKNFSVGDHVAFAPVGTTLAGGLKIKEAKIRGVVSRGMLCSEKELGLSTEHAGILILPADVATGEGRGLGKPLANALGRNDTVLEIGVTPNRPDALSHIGIAREVAAAFEVRAKIASPTCAERGGPIESFAHVTIEDPEGCPRYACRVVKGVKVAPSPAWLVSRLAACGVRSVNNVVDVTNLVMMERGIPLHAFDLDRIDTVRDRAEVIVRRAKEGEKIVSLDGTERELVSGDVVIADPNKAIAIAGVMGGENSEVTDDTTRILLEAAYFAPAFVRRTARRLGIHSEASHRFERGCDPNGVRQSLDRAASILADLTDGEVCRDAIDVYPKKIEERMVSLRPKRAAALLGLPEKDLDETTTSSMLLRLGLEVAGRDADGLRIRVPTWRPDLEREVDLIEEVLRLIGYDKVEPTLPTGTGIASTLFNRPRHQATERTRTALGAAGYFEAINLAFTSPQTISLFEGGEGVLDDSVEIQNPLGEEMSRMRRSLLPGLLENVALNHRHNTTNVRLYEVGTVFLGKNPKGSAPRKADADGPKGGDAWAIERPRLAGVLAGEVASEAFDAKPRPADFYDVKGHVEEVLRANGIVVELHAAAVRFDPPSAEDAPHPSLHPGAQASIFVTPHARSPAVKVGVVGELHPRLRDALDLKSSAFAFELDTDALAAVATARPSATPLPRFPSVRRDLAVVVDDSVPAGEMCRTFAQYDAVQGILEDVSIFDVYRGDHIEAGKKSVALTFTFRSHARTLKDEEVAQAADAIIAGAKDTFGAQIRE